MLSVLKTILKIIDISIIDNEAAVNSAEQVNLSDIAKIKSK